MKFEFSLKMIQHSDESEREEEEKEKKTRNVSPVFLLSLSLAPTRSTSGERQKLWKREEKKFFSRRRSSRHSKKNKSGNDFFRSNG